ncbi:ABC transporter substrate-binding protein [Azotobacter chroococcum]|uniref:ABC transporter substrate-binding protein n=1 Tax=Azotobacter chroococcum TaxID=353 RepID=UPI00103E34D4|nr:ABC transporter substrate-binding protein [Azotobacter chroococcum]TBW08014.1 ABC transporter substrate-binding protein [Azotobacter chroococcum]
MTTPQHTPADAGHPALPAPGALGALDLLGRMPIPLRRAFKAGLDQTLAAQRAAGGPALNCCCLGGGEWYSPFDSLASERDPARLPGLLVSTVYQDILAPDLLAHYAPGRAARPLPELHPACAAAGLADPLGAFRVFSVIPFVWLIDRRRLKGRRPPRVWSDLLDPQWAGEIVFGGWRPNPQVAYQDYNAYLLLALYLEFGQSGLAAFAGNVRHLQHNVRTATQAGSNSPDVGAIAVLPWLQAELCPRRERTSVVWPEDGALAMPIGYLLKPGQEARLAPLIDYLHGAQLGAVLARNCYPPTGAAHARAFPPGARLKWPGWAFFHTHDFAAEQRRAAELFFAAQGGLRLCN